MSIRTATADFDTTMRSVNDALAKLQTVIALQSRAADGPTAPAGYRLPIHVDVELRQLANRI